ADAQRYAPFPLDQFQPKRMLGAGGFGAVFLCQDRYMQADVVVKSLHHTDMVRSADEAFAEARVLRQLSQAFRGSVEKLQARLPALLKKAANPRIDEGWPGWNARLARLRAEAKKPAQMTVALLGTMGSGKSTLINTLVGAEVLATKGAGEACTAVPCEL